MRNLAIVGAVLLFLTIFAVSFADESSEYYYAIEQDGQVCGYGYSTVTKTSCDGRPCLKLIDSLHMQVQALGKAIEGNYTFQYYIDPATGEYFHHTSEISQGGMHLDAVIDVANDTVTIVGAKGTDTTVVALPEGTVLQNTRFFPFLLKFFVQNALSEKTCPTFSEVDGTIDSVTYKNMGREALKFDGKKHDALKVDVLNRRTGIQFKLWVDASTGLMLKMEHPVRTVYLTDSGVRDRIARANLDSHIFANVDTIIANPWAISSMKVHARMKPMGMWLSVENLNVPGQHFEGTVVDNQVDGVFEITRKRYDGTGAPAFPCDFTGVDSLKRYLQPGDMVESDEPVLIAKAKQLTEGATNAWDAACRLSKWVNKEIGYDVPGGGTALKTYELRLGECGSHANLLTAFCRAVGIPARGVFGCMYVPEHGGAFGQHAWNEIYMGKTGWIPVDATVDEVTYVDCGHLRIGEWVSKAAMFNPEKMEILNFTVGEGTYADLARASEHDLQQLVGKYQGPDEVLTILVQNDRLALDVPGQMVFQLKDPDENGEWFFALTDRASVSFDIDSDGLATALTIHSRQRLTRDNSEDSTQAEADRATSEYAGKYTLPMANLTFAVVEKSGGLVLVTPHGTELPLARGESADEWTTDTGKSTMVITFDHDEAGSVSALKYCELVTCLKMAAVGE